MYSPPLPPQFYDDNYFNNINYRIDAIYPITDLSGGSEYYEEVLVPNKEKKLSISDSTIYEPTVSSYINYIGRCIKKDYEELIYKIPENGVNSKIFKNFMI
jgi:hypothetical protein